MRDREREGGRKRERKRERKEAGAMVGGIHAGWVGTGTEGSEVWAVSSSHFRESRLE